jgi:hypothetical protein
MEVRIEEIVCMGDSSWPPIRFYYTQHNYIQDISKKKGDAQHNGRALFC